jgi:predicted GNAT family acetyltransferase
MSMDLYKKYIMEREGRDLIEVDNGFITFRKLNDTTYYIVDLYVDSSVRKTGIARSLFDNVCDVARNDGAQFIMGSICTDANGVTGSMAALLAVGFEFSSQTGTMLYFIKTL